MKNLIYLGDVDIQLQGFPALSFVEKNDQFARFDIIGFSDTVRIIDFRETILEAVEALLLDGDLIKFAPKFNQLAYAEIWEDEESHLTIELRDPYSNRANRYMLWIAVGIDDEAPVYNYLFEKWQLISNNQYAFVSIYQRPLAKRYLSEGVEEGVGFSSVSANT